MSAKIDKNACIACGVCVMMCPSDVFRLEEGSSQPRVAYPSDCTDCRLCERNCSFYAIKIITPQKETGRPFTFSLYLKGLGI